MADNIKTYSPDTIQDQPFPAEGTEVPMDSSQTSGTDVIKPETIKSNPLPRKVIAHETIGAALNTKSRKILAEFEFTKNGAIQVGEYENGVSGDIRISPNGLTARNKSGITTVGIDGDTGDAVFKGSVQAGSVITGAVAVGDNDIVIDGESKTMIFYTNDIPSIVIGEV